MEMMKRRRHAVVFNMSEDNIKDIEDYYKSYDGKWFGVNLTFREDGNIHAKILMSQMGFLVPNDAYIIFEEDHINICDSNKLHETFINANDFTILEEEI